MPHTTDLPIPDPSRSPRRRCRALAVLGAALTVAAGAIAEPAAAAPSSGSGGAQAPTAKRGAHVVALQRALGIAADGVFGRQTRRAVRRFQRADGLVVDGVAGPQTLRALSLTARAASAGSLLQRISACESGGDPDAVSPDGRYRGKYQFSRATWRSLGGTGDPAKAPETVQDRLAAKLLAASGTSPWPNCA